MHWSVTKRIQKALGGVGVGVGVKVKDAQHVSPAKSDKGLQGKCEGVSSEQGEHLTFHSQSGQSVSYFTVPPRAHRTFGRAMRLVLPHTVALRGTGFFHRQAKPVEHLRQHRDFTQQQLRTHCPEQVLSGCQRPV